jgi:uncharacterized OB-fold protein
MTELITIPGRWEFDYTYFAGEAASRFFGELKDSRRIMGVCCPSCKRVLVPARSFCDVCFQRTEEWVEVGPEGVVETFTILTAAFAGMPKPPVVIAYVTFDGADTALLNVLTGLDLSNISDAAHRLQARPRVRASFVDEPQGRITDFTFTLL